jgi:SAM-dependent methyltransferase
VWHTGDVVARDGDIGTERADAFDAFEAAGWEDRAADYDRSWSAFTAGLADPILDAAGVGPGTRVLDVACGPGRLAGRAAARGAEATGVDIAEAMVRRARRHHRGARFRRGDAQALPFPDGAFDAVVSSLGLPHFGRPERAVAEFGRVLVDAGRLALTCWDLPQRTPLVGVLVAAVRAAGATPPPSLPPGPDFFRFGDPGELAALLTGTGFTDVEIRALTLTYRTDSPDELWDALMRGTVRTAAMIRGQPEEVIARVRAAFDRGLDAHRAGGRYQVPASFVLGTGRAPTSGR